MAKENIYLASKPRYDILDGLRGVAALMVVIFHCFETYIPVFKTQIVNHGYLAVDFFFVLSGFVIGYAYDDRWDKMTTWGFFKRRLTRLHPMVIAGTLVGAALFFFAGAAFPETLKVPAWKTENEQRWESICVEDAEVVTIAYGISSRVCKEAVLHARAQGIKLGLIRPKMVVPFPVKAFDEIGPDCKGLLVVEMSIKGQMVEDVALASRCKYPIYGYLTSYEVPESDKVIEMAQDILAGNAKEVF